MPSFLVVCGGLIVVLAVAGWAFRQKNTRKRSPVVFESFPPDVAPTQGPVVVITGGNGFLGKWLTRVLLDHYGEGSVDIRVFDMAVPAPGSPDCIPTVTYVRGDVTKRDHLVAAFEGADTVFHLCGLIPSVTASDEALFQVNVVGTEMVIVAARRVGVGAVVYTSSATAVMALGVDILNGTEDLPYPSSEAHAHTYTRTKQLAEELILGANDPQKGLSTCCVRPTAIYAENDGALATTCLNGSASRFVGNGENLVDFVHAEDVAAGHLAASLHLGPGTDNAAAGQIYNLGSDAPVSYATFFGAGQNPSWWGQPEPMATNLGVMKAMAAMNDWSWKLLRWTPLPRSFGSYMFPFVTQTYTFSSAKARRQLGFKQAHTPVRKAVARMVRVYKEANSAGLPS